MRSGIEVFLDDFESCIVSCFIFKFALKFAQHQLYWFRHVYLTLL
jgi:hypothetical protein